LQSQEPDADNSSQVPGPQTPEPGRTDAEGRASEAITDAVALPSARAQTEIDAKSLLQRFPCVVVLLAGEVSSGKTSIITAIYERLQRGKLDRWSFAWSDTLIGFEERCWEGRTASGGFRDHIARTSLQSTDYLLHLRLMSEDAVYRNLLLADVSGEVFREMKSHPAVAADLAILARCDHLTILVDGAKLAVPADRQVAINDARVILRASLEYGRLHPSAQIQIVLAKSDRVRRGRLDEGWIRQWVFDPLADLAAQHGRRISTVTTAARPDSTEELFDLGYGAEHLLSAWTLPVDSAKPALKRPDQHVREFLRYVYSRETSSL
jgi:hypothetical protein